MLQLGPEPKKPGPVIRRPAPPSKNNIEIVEALPVLDIAGRMSAINGRISEAESKVSMIWFEFEWQGLEFDSGRIRSEGVPLHECPFGVRLALFKKLPEFCSLLLAKADDILKEHGL